jgi:hypothetical protein
MSNEYLGSSYTIPWSGAVPYAGPGNIGASDDFANSRPQLLNGSGQPLPGWAGLDERWKVWDPGHMIDFLGVDTRTQRCLLRSVGKFMCGVYQSLPLPTVIGQTVECAVYAQCSIASAQSFPDFGQQVGPTVLGLILADDLDGAPTTSSVHVVGLGFTKQADAPGTVVGSVLSPVVADFLAYDSGITGQPAQCEGTGAYFRARIAQTYVDATPNYQLDIIAEWSTDGAGYMPLVRLPQEIRSAPLKSAGLGLFPGAGSRVALSCDQFSIVLQGLDDESPLIGGVQVLGSV